MAHAITAAINARKSAIGDEELFVSKKPIIKPKLAIWATARSKKITPLFSTSKPSSP